MINRILFATDLSVFTSYALMHVESIAEQYQAQVVLVHAVPPIGDFTTAVVKSFCSDDVKNEVLGSLHITGLLDSIKEEVFEQVVSSDDLSENGLLSHVTDIVVAPGNPAGIILDEAERIQADLIVIGSHGTEAIDGRILGSVATKVLQLSKVPVYLIPMMNAQAVYQAPSEGSDTLNKKRKGYR